MPEDLIALDIAGRITAIVALGLGTYFARRFQTVFVGYLCTLAVVTSFHLSQDALASFGGMIMILTYSSLLMCIPRPLYELRQELLLDWTVFMVGHMLSVFLQHAPAAGIAGALCCYAARQTTYFWSWFVWAACSAVVYVWTPLTSVWLAVGFLLLLLTERQVTNKKII